jgi:hypothetical protein
MGEISREIRISYTDAKLNAFFESIPSNGSGAHYAKRFNYNEEFFLSLDSSILVPHIPIHHNVRKDLPEEAYMESLRVLFSDIAGIDPSLFSGLTYIFNPQDVFRPLFYRLYRLDTKQYLFLLRFDFLFKPQYCEVIEQGTNDISPLYKTNRIFMEGNFVPLQSVRVIGGRIEAFEIMQVISETWIGERGRGYMLQGIWIDNALTRFFSKLFMPEGKSVYPFYPFLCKHKTVCGNVISFSPREREAELPYLAEAIRFLEPEMHNIERELKNHDFSPDQPIFKHLKSRVPEMFRDYKKDVVVNPYLNDHNMKEYTIVI